MNDEHAINALTELMLRERQKAAGFPTAPLDKAFIADFLQAALYGVSKTAALTPQGCHAPKGLLRGLGYTRVVTDAEFAPKQESTDEG